MKGTLGLALGIITLAAACGDDGGSGNGDGGNGGDAGVPDANGGPDAAPDCVFTPTGEFNPAVECTWNGPGVGVAYANYNDVVMTPVVINLTDDNADSVVDTTDIPDIAFTSYRLQEDGCCNVNGVLRVVSGGCDGAGTLVEHFSIGATEIEADTGTAGIWLDNSGGLAVGDIDDDGAPDIVGMINGGGTIAFERDGSVKWINTAHPDGDDRLAAVQPSIANIDATGDPEVIVGRVVLNGEDGTLQWEGTAGVGTNGFLGPVSSSGDLDLDGDLDVLAGNTMYDPSGTPVWTYPYSIPITAGNCDATGFPCDGFTATGNFDADDEGELVIARAGVIYILNHDGTPLMVNAMPVAIDIPKIDCGLNEGGPPTVADFDGDGEPEIGVAAADFYIVADLQCLITPLPAECSDPGIRWKVANADCSSRVTGSSVFDFDADGRAEVAYADEDFFRILDGVDGSERLSIANQSHTRLEMPIIVDVDNDGNAEIVFVENAHGGGPSQGIRVYGDATDSWASTRRIWNQHAYHVTNVSELGAIPLDEPVNWLEPTANTEAGVMNNFRQNLPENDANAAPDLTISLTLVEDGCVLIGRVCNEGDVVVGAGLPVHFWDNATMTEIPCAGGVPTTSAPLPPGACVDVQCVWNDAPADVDIRGCVDNDGYTCDDATGANNECNEGNNQDNRAGPFDCTPIG
jgi:hypothetical protein